MLTDSSLSVIQKKQLFKKKYKYLDEIISHENDRLTGKILRKTATEIQIITVFGLYKINRSKIKLRRKIKSSNAFWCLTCRFKFNKF